ncbi:MAG: DUF2267 domain-containing protein [Hyphomicrobiales bacterium]
MEELIGRIVSNVGIDEGLAQKAVGMILGFLQQEGPEDKVSSLMGALPGAEDLISAASGGGGGGGGLMGAVGGLMGGGGGGGGGGAMALMGQLTGAGLGMGDVQGVAGEVMGFAKEKAGEDTVAEIVGAIPGLDQFV